MASATTAANTAYLTRRLLRRVLREGAKNPVFSYKNERSRPWRDALLSQFKKYKDVESAEKIDGLKQIGDTYVCMLKNMKEHYDLISIHYRLADQRKSVEMASRRVGLALPEWPETKEERLEREKEDAEVMVAHMKLQEAAARMQASTELPKLTPEMFMLGRNRNKGTEEEDEKKQQ